MSLLSTASPWNNNDTKKRTPSLRKTVKIRPYTNEIITEQADEYEGMATLDNLKQENDSRSNRVNDLLNQMSNVTADDDGQHLADFKPPPIPEMSMKKNIPIEPDGRPADEPIDRPNNSLQIPIPMIPKGSNPYYSSNQHLSNYQTVYEQGMPQYKPIGLQNNPVESSNLLEKINYMIHLLENQENEKTANVTEEFILYTFLGVFMIYVVDSFSRGGKYVR